MRPLRPAGHCGAGCTKASVHPGRRCGALRPALRRELGALPRDSKDRWQKVVLPAIRVHLTTDQRRLYTRFADGRTTPEQTYQRELFGLLLHEIGHALGLVPSNGQAGGVSQIFGWRDSAHGNHCQKDSCVMFHLTETAQVAGVRVRLGEHKPFNHSTIKFDGCTLYLRACDLSDIRNFPS